MIDLCRDAALMSRIANSDGVREFVGIEADGQRDWDAWASLPAEKTGVYCLTNGEDALGVADLYNGIGQQIPGKVMGHWLFAASCRGRRAIDTGREMIAWLHDHGFDVWGNTPRENRKAIWFNHRIGGVELSTSDPDSVNFEWRKPH